MKKQIFSLLMGLISFLPFSQSQVHISNLFNLNEELNLSELIPELPQDELVGCLDGDNLFVTYRRAYQQKSTQYTAQVYQINIKTKNVKYWGLPFPEKNVTALSARHYWIYALAIIDQQCVVATQSSLLMYNMNGGKPKLSKRIPAKELPEWIGKTSLQLSAISKNLNSGFTLRANIEKDTLSILQTFTLPAPFMLQYGPNGFLKYYDEHFYFLPSPEFKLQKYDVYGNFLAEVKIDIPDVSPMSVDYQQKVSAMPYGSERAMYNYFHAKAYSFPLEIIVLNENHFLLAYHHFDSNMKKEKIQMGFLTVDKNWQHSHISLFETFFNLDSVIRQEEFPFYYAQPEALLLLSNNQYVVQISKEANVPFVGNTGRQYDSLSQSYYLQNAPCVKARIMNLKCLGNKNIQAPWNKRGRMIDMDSLPPIENIEGSIWHWRDEGLQKKLLIVNRAPQCHECANNLYQWLNENIGEKIQVKILNIGPLNPLWRREIKEQIYHQLGAKVTPLFSLINKQQQWEALLGTEYFPVILLQHPPDSMAMVIAYEDLFSANPLDRMLPASTQQRLLRFSQE